MRFKPRQLVQVILSLALAIWIFWFLYKDIKLASLVEALGGASFLWIGLSIMISIWGYWIRAWRWKLLIDADGQQKSRTSHIFWALMTGYLVNLLIPRAGEVARCGVLKRTDHLQMGKLLGTVILERTVDLLLLISIILLAFLAENRIFLSLANDLVSLDSLKNAATNYLPLFLVVVVIAGGLGIWVYRVYRDKGLIRKLRHFARDFVKGLKSVKQVSNQTGFWSSSIMIWIIYFLMMYFVALGIPSTAALDASSVLMVMVMGSIGMIAPVQGGVGTFHALVAFILLYYGLSEEDGKIFAAIIHGTQMLTVLVLGLISVFVVIKITPKEEPKESLLR